MLYICENQAAEKMRKSQMYKITDDIKQKFLKQENNTAVNRKRSVHVVSSLAFQ